MYLQKKRAAREHVYVCVCIYEEGEEGWAGVHANMILASNETHLNTTTIHPLTHILNRQASALKISAIYRNMGYYILLIFYI